MRNVLAHRYFGKGEQLHLRMIQNPGARLTAEMLYKQVQWLVQEKDWRAQGEEVT